MTDPKHADNQDTYQQGFPTDDAPEDSEEETQVEYSQSECEPNRLSDE
jgi:hypothetical protein